MMLFAQVDAQTDWGYVVACTAVPILWGAVVHWLFDAWHQRRSAVPEPTPQPLESEVEEPNLP